MYNIIRNYYTYDHLFESGVVRRVHYKWYGLLLCKWYTFLQNNDDNYKILFFLENAKW